MKAIAALALIVLSAMSADAADREQATVEKLLRDNGLSPRARPSWHEKFALEIRGTERKPELVTTSCATTGNGRKSFRGSRFNYIADNRGEWGGELNMRDGDEALRPIVPGNVRDLIPVEDDLYVFTGLSHIGVDYGALHVIENFDTEPKGRLLTQLPESSDVVVFDRNWGGFLVVSSLSIGVVDLRGGLHMVMARHAYMPRPNSVMTIGPADILVGLCGGVAWIHAPWRMNRPPDPADEIPIVTYWTRQ
jgi:hypothetical protein